MYILKCFNNINNNMFSKNLINLGVNILSNGKKKMKHRYVNKMLRYIFYNWNTK